MNMNKLLGAESATSLIMFTEIYKFLKTRWSYKQTDCSEQNHVLTWGFLIHFVSSKLLST